MTELWQVLDHAKGAVKSGNLTALFNNKVVKGKCCGELFWSSVGNADLWLECIAMKDERKAIKEKRMDFEKAKELLKESVDEAETQGDILRIWIEKVYQKGKTDGNSLMQVQTNENNEFH